MDRSRVEDLLRRRGRASTPRPLLGEVRAAELRARVAADARRAVAGPSPWKRPAWIATAAGVLLLASLVVTLQRPGSFGSVPVRGSFADARGRQLSSIRSDGPRSLPREFYVSVRPEEDAFVRLVLYGSDGRRHELPTAPDAATSRLGPELFNLGPYRLEEDQENPSRERLDLLILSSSREIPTMTACWSALSPPGPG